MGLGKFIFGEKKINKSIDTTPSIPSKDAKVFSGGVYKTRDALRGKMSSLKTMKIDGKVLKKEEWVDMMTDLVKKRQGSITVRQLEKDLYLKKHIGQRERARIMTWAKKNFVKQDQAKKDINNRSARKINAKDTLEAQVFVSPKSESKLESSVEANRLGVKSVQTGFQRGHGGGVAGMGKSNSQRTSLNQSQGMVRGSQGSVTRGAPRRGW